MRYWKNCLRPIVFALPLDPEHAHRLAIVGLALLGRLGWLQVLVRRRYVLSSERLRVSMAGLSFPSPVGLAAGFDKDGEALAGLCCLGFGSIEVGTVTPCPQPGNRRPRIFRIPKEQVLINRMGFNNGGADALARRLTSSKTRNVPIGVSIGKCRDTAPDFAARDYVAAFRGVYPVADYVAVNVSSPNTPGLRDLLVSEWLGIILPALQTENERLSGRGATKPVFVKLSPDMSDDDLVRVLRVCEAAGVAGVIASNTSLDTSLLRARLPEGVSGGISGKVLFGRTLRTVELIRQNSPDLAIIAVGGIFTGDDAYLLMRAGASLVQIYAALVFEGPSVVRAINDRLLALLERDDKPDLSGLARPAAPHARQHQRG